MRSVSVLVVFFVCMWCMGVSSRGGGVSGYFCHGYFQCSYFPDYYLRGNIFSHGSILGTKMGSKFVTDIKKETPLHFQASFLVN